jgi:hypothetical protein
MGGECRLIVGEGSSTVVITGTMGAGGAAEGLTHISAALSAARKLITNFGEDGGLSISGLMI